MSESAIVEFRRTWSDTLRNTYHIARSFEIIYSSRRKLSHHQDIVMGKVHATQATVGLMTQDTPTQNDRIAATKIFNSNFIN